MVITVSTLLLFYYTHFCDDDDDDVIIIVVEARRRTMPDTTCVHTSSTVRVGLFDSLLVLLKLERILVGGQQQLETNKTTQTTIGVMTYNFICILYHPLLLFLLNMIAKFK